MRQLVTIVTDEHVRYLVSDGGEAVQIAQTINPGLDVQELVTFGDMLTSALHLNGKEPKRQAALARAEQPALPKPKAAAKRAPKPPVSVGNQSWGANRHAVLDHIRKHPGTTYVEITRAVCGTDNPKAVQSVSAAVGWWRANGDAHGVRIDSTPRDVVDAQGRTRAGVGLTLVESDAEPTS